MRDCKAMILYKTVMHEAEAVQIIEKSKFICTVKPVTDREEANEFFDKIRKKYKDATHNVPCMVIGEKSELQWASDDGEPKGTSGAPMVQMLVAEGVTNIALVVTRYFGGIKLGTGGLVRAYTGSAKLGLEAAKVGYMKELVRISFQVDYSFLSTLQYMAQTSDNIKIDEIVYEDRVVIFFLTESENRDIVMQKVAENTQGTAIKKNEEFVKKVFDMVP
ncbi:MAG: YigZ family protein [Eubacteriales bacterium]